MEKIPDRLVNAASSLRGPVIRVGQWLSRAVVVCVVGLKDILTQSGQRDLLTAIIASVGLLGPVWIGLGGLQTIGVGGGALCTSGQMGILAVVITTPFELLVAFFLFKGLLRTMVALSRASDELVDPVLSIVGAFVPIVVGSLLRVGNASLIGCLYP